MLGRGSIPPPQENDICPVGSFPDGQVHIAAVGLDRIDNIDPLFNEGGDILVYRSRTNGECAHRAVSVDKGAELRTGFVKKIAVDIEDMGMVRESIPRSSPKRRMSAVSPTAAQTFSRLPDKRSIEQFDEHADKVPGRYRDHEKIVHPAEKRAPLKEVAAGDDHEGLIGLFPQLQSAAARLSRSQVHRHDPRDCEPVLPKHMIHRLVQSLFHPLAGVGVASKPRKESLVVEGGLIGHFRYGGYRRRSGGLSSRPVNRERV